MAFNRSMLGPYKCPYCGTGIPCASDSYRMYHLTMGYCEDKTPLWVYHGEPNPRSYGPPDDICVEYYMCLECRQLSVIVTAHLGKDVDGIEFPIKPRTNAMIFPDYVPAPIRSDYEEACLIRSLSPKASATLCRRCLQGMLRDFWSVYANTLAQEINQIQDKVSPKVWQVIHALRKLGNIGAHMEHDVNLLVDIDPGEADRLIRLIEYLIQEWYIRDHDAQTLMADILDVSAQKDQQRHPQGK